MVHQQKQVFEHSKELIRAFTPVRFFLMLIGQMPFDIKKKKDNTYTFKLNSKSKSWFFFLFMFTVSTLSYLMITLGILSFILNQLSSNWIKPQHTIMVTDPVTGENEAQLWERYYTRKEMVPVLVIWCWLTISFVGSLHLILYGKFYVHYMNYFNRVVQVMDMDMTPGIQNYLWKNNLLTMLVAVGLIVGFSLQTINFNAIKNTASIIANFVLRMFKIEIAALESGPQLGCQIFGILIMFFGLVGSRANIIQFLFFSQLLKNGAKIWNERFTMALEIDQVELKKLAAKQDGNQFHRRLDLKHVLKDHLILVQLFRMTESVFGFVLLTYYCFEIVSVVMEIYQLAALGGFTTRPSKAADDDETIDNSLTETEREEFDPDRAQEWETFSTVVVCIALMFQHAWFAISTTSDASSAFEQAMEGFHILRQHGFMYCRNKSDRNFVLSMFMSFSKRAPMQLTAGGYFAINKALLVAMSAAIVSWAVSIYQTKVDQWK